MTINCSECNNVIDHKGAIMRCCDGTVCSSRCSLNRYEKNKKKNFQDWNNTSVFLINPEKTTDKKIYKIHSFIPIYISDRSKINDTAENLKNKYLNIEQEIKQEQCNNYPDLLWDESYNIFDISNNICDASYNIINNVQDSLTSTNIYNMFRYMLSHF